MADLEGLTVEELNMLADGLTAWEHMQHAAPQFLTLNSQEDNTDKMKQAQTEVENVHRGIMEAATLLKAKLIGRKTVLQAESAIKDVLSGEG